MSDQLELRRDFSDAERKKLAESGAALPDGSYPIVTVGDLHNAIQAVGRAKDAGAAKAHIIKRAKALGATDELPEDWRALQVGDDVEDRAMKACPTCEGSGTVEGEPCTDCDGTGEVQAGGPPQRSAESTLESRLSPSERLRGTMEHRSFTADGAEIRSTSDGGLRFSGYASTTETPYRVGGFEETFARGAFKRCLNEDPDVVLLINHEGLPLARTKSGTMTLSEDARGLKVDADLDENDPDVQALVPKMRRGDLTEMSFAFKATDDEWTERDSKRLVRSATIHKGDVSVVTHGANSTTTAGLRSLVADFEERAGRVLSKANKDRLEAIKAELDAMAMDGEPDPADVAQATTEQQLHVQLHPRSDTGAMKARVARLRGAAR
jgi:HK97 family phage prohead protease